MSDFPMMPVGTTHAPVYGFTRTMRHALVQHTDGDWYAHPIDTMTGCIVSSGRWEAPGWMIESDPGSLRYEQGFPLTP